MPLLNRKPFVQIKPPLNIKPEDKIFFCEQTGEVFTEYDTFWQRLVLLNALLWTCEFTGKPNLTFQEALDSENKARKNVATVSPALTIPILYISNQTKRNRIADMNDQVFNYLRDRYFVGEEVEAIVNKHWYDCKVSKVIMPSEEDIDDYEREMADSDDEDIINEEKNIFPVNGCVDPIEDDDEIMIIHDDRDMVDPLKQNKFPIKKSIEDYDEYPPYASVKYEVIEIEPWDYKVCQKHVVKWNQIRRNKSALTRDKCKIFLKAGVTLSPEGYWVIKDSILNKYNIRDMSYTKIFVGIIPKFEVSIRKIHAVNVQNSEKKKLKEKIIEKKRIKKKEKKEIKLKNSLENIERNINKKTKHSSALQEIKLLPPKTKEVLKAEKEKQKEEIRMQLELQKVEKRRNNMIAKEETRLMSIAMNIWNEPQEDLLLDDHKKLPQPTPVQCRIPSEYFGDFLMVLQFVNVFCDTLELKDVYPNGITFDMLEHAFIEKEVAGIYNDIMQLLLGAIFNLQQEEDEEILEGQTTKNESINVERYLEIKTHNAATILANDALSWMPQNLNICLQKAPLDALTLTELLRVHLLASGATNVRNAYWRLLNRGGYQNFDDPGLQFKIDEPEILKKLSTETLFDLNLGEKVKLFNTLVAQIITYASVRDTIDENIEKQKELRNDMKQYKFSEIRKEKEEILMKKQKEKEEKLKKLEKLEKIKLEKEQSMKKVQDDNKSPEKVQEDNKSPENVQDDNKSLEKVQDENKAPTDLDIDVNENEEYNEYIREKEELKKERRRIEYQKKIDHFLNKFIQVSQKVCELPLGEDRCHRRYWLYSNLPALIVEDDSENVGSCLPHRPLSQNPEICSDFRRKIQLRATKNVTQMQKLKEVKRINDKENESKPAMELNKSHVNGEINDVIILDDDSSPTISKEESDEDFIYSIMDSMTPDIIENGVDHDKNLWICNSDPDSCQIHSNYERSRWNFYHKLEDFEQLFNTLNKRGDREFMLRQNLADRRDEIESCIKNCPAYKLNSSIEQPEAQITERKSQRGAPVLGTPSANLNFPADISVSMIFELTLRDMILEFEDKMTVGFLGSLKSTDRTEWREAILNSLPLPKHCYDVVDIGGTNRIRRFKIELGIEKKEDSITNEGKIKDQTTFSTLRLAIILLGKAVDQKYLREPVAESDKLLNKRTKAELGLKHIYKKEAVESSSDEELYKDQKKKSRVVSDHILRTSHERWEKSLFSSTSFSQLFLHLAILDRSVAWGRSILKAACPKCRKKGDPENMLLCDECNRGYHMYCLVPKIKSIPSGDWFCEKCKPKEKPKTPKKQRKIYKDISDDEIENDLDTIEEIKEEENQEFCAACETGGELILCDTCPRSFHLDCAYMRKVPRGRWSCPLCKDEEEKPSRRRGVKRALEPVEEPEVNYHHEVIDELLCDIGSLSESGYFKKPLARYENDDYYSKIKKPMDFRTIRNRFNKGKYTLDTEFTADVLLIFQNCQQYFKESSEEYKASVKLSKFFIKKSDEYNLTSSSHIRKKRKK